MTFEQRVKDFKLPDAFQGFVRRLDLCLSRSLQARRLQLPWKLNRLESPRDVAVAATDDWQCRQSIPPHFPGQRTFPKLATRAETSTAVWASFFAAIEMQKLKIQPRWRAKP